MTHKVTAPFYWADLPGDPKVPGVRIDRARGWVFIPDTELLDLANTLTDHLTRKDTP